MDLAFWIEALGWMAFSMVKFVVTLATAVAAGVPPLQAFLWSSLGAATGLAAMRPLSMRLFGWFAARRRKRGKANFTPFAPPHSLHKIPFRIVGGCVGWRGPWGAGGRPHRLQIFWPPETNAPGADCGLHFVECHLDHLGGLRIALNHGEIMAFLRPRPDPVGL